MGRVCSGSCGNRCAIVISLGWWYLVPMCKLLSLPPSRGKEEQCWRQGLLVCVHSQQVVRAFSTLLLNAFNCSASLVLQKPYLGWCVLRTATTLAAGRRMLEASW